MRNKIRSILQNSWCSAFNGVDLDLAVDNIVLYIEDIKEDYDRTISNLEDEISSLNMQLDEESEDCDECEVNLICSNDLLQECLPELNRLLEINSNNPNKYRELNQLIYRIEEQIIKNAK